MKSGFVHINYDDDTLDPQYMDFLDNLKEDKGSYVLEIAVHSGLTVRMKYEYEYEIQKGSRTRALHNLGQNWGLKANNGIESRAKVPRVSDDVSRGEIVANMETLRTFPQEEHVDRKKKTCLNEENIETEVIMRNGVTKKRVNVPQVSNDDALMRQRQRNANSLKASLQKDPANREGRACCQMGHVERELTMWDGRAEKEVEIPRSSYDASVGRKLVLRTSSQTEPANRKRKARCNEGNVERGLLTGNGLIEKAVDNRRNLHGVSREKGDKSLRPWKISSKGEPVNREARACQKKEKLENALVSWNSKTERRVEVPQNLDDVFWRRKVDSKRLLQIEPAVRNIKAYPNNEIVESGLITRNDAPEKQIGISQNSKDISREKRHKNAKPFETSLQREPINKKGKGLLMRRNPDTKSANPLCGGGGLSKMGGQLVPQFTAHDSRHFNIGRLDDADESYVALVSPAYHSKAYITSDYKTERHAKNNGDSLSEVGIFGVEDLSLYAEKSPMLTNNVCYTYDHRKEMDMDSKKSPRIPGRTCFKPRNVKPLDISSQSGPINGKIKNLWTKKNPETISADPLCNDSIRRLDDPDESYIALVSQAYNANTHITNDNRTDNCAKGGGDSSSEVEILEIEELSRYGEKNPFVISCTNNEVDMVGRESPQALSITHFNPFREKLIALLKRPFDSNEYSRLLTKAAYRKPKQIVRICPDGKKRVYDTVSKSLLNQYSDLVEKIDVVRSDRRRVLNLLRGFFYYLQNQSVQGSFLPWLDSSCLMVLPDAK